ncbi:MULTISPECIES: MBL fold metallo-hydrolase [Oceanotoga]|uniref:Metallo-beta-lactamase superfamily protein n=1 Tax=Oceanotoga teriensis TaxID=515440 RepID=A0AA45C8T5_9BACT|nr:MULTISPECIES: MBL fold metallo-hydrolase [Oceanotoga]MDN5342109.1 metallo-beta-lactamase class [Oceanotoga sp.]MDO7975421.1 MBL fold metallo-hydrolase [Oceanotoga teriensis]PWJ96291.1 metallo-beta-lactamase superfamily protein [Oceanotoga teriensis]
MLYQYNNLYFFWFENGASNITFLEYSKGLIAFDSSLYPKKFNEMTEIIEDKTGKKLKNIYLTHYHPDHSFGAIFNKKNLHITMSDLTFKYLTNFTENQLREISKLSDFNFSDININFENKNIELFTNTNYNIIDDIIVSSKIVGGHTTDSTIYMLKPMNVLISGDLIFSKVHSELYNSNIDLWVNTLESLKKINFKKIAPGHGKPGESDLIKLQLDYLFSDNDRRLKDDRFKNYLLNKIIL